MDTDAGAVVAGESAAQLLDVLVEVRNQSSFEPDVDGMCRFGAVIPDERALPFVRAMLRVEAELMHEEAARLTATAGLRTPEQRAADAFVALALRVSEALMPPGGP